MTTELKPCPKCYSNRVTCWNVTGGNQIVCKDCGLRNKPHPIETVVRDDWNTRAVPDVPEDKLILELDRYDPVHIYGRVVGMEINKFGEYVSYNQVTALVASEPTAKQALQAITDLPYGKNDDINSGHEDAYRAIEALHFMRSNR